MAAIVEYTRLANCSDIMSNCVYCKASDGKLMMAKLDVIILKSYLPNGNKLCCLWIEKWPCKPAGRKTICHACFEAKVVGGGHTTEKSDVGGSKSQNVEKSDVGGSKPQNVEKKLL